MLAEVYDAGKQHVVEFPKIGEPPSKPVVPLTLVICEKCYLVQLRYSTNPIYLYEEFWYRSGTNEMMRAALKDVANCAFAYAAPNRGDWVLDIGCNDGTLLESYPPWLNCVGMDPARNLGLREEKSWKFVCDYFSSAKALDASVGLKYKVVTALAMFYDLDSPVEFCQEVKKVLHEDGVFIVQMNYLPAMLKNNGVDNLCHEHLTYFSLHTLIPVFEEAGLAIYKAELNDVNGGSIRVYAKHETSDISESSLSDGSNLSIGEILRQEYDEGIGNLRHYARFGKQVVENCRLLNTWLDALNKVKRRVYAYGASTRGTTLLQLLDTKDKIIACAERDERKIGHYMVGADLPIVDEQEFRTEAQYGLLLPWHFWKSVKKREVIWLQQGGRMIVPFPNPTIADWREQ
jgi:SAM-dependent methyltransferase